MPSDKETLEDMEKMGVIRMVDRSTEWVNSLVVVEKPKSKKLRACLDPRLLIVPSVESTSTFPPWRKSPLDYQEPFLDATGRLPLVTTTFRGCHLGSNWLKRYFRVNEPASR